MKKFILTLGILAALFSSKSVMAQEQTYTTISSVTYGGVWVTTGTPVQIDNQLPEGVMKSRNEIKFSVPSSGVAIYYGYDNHVSSCPKTGGFKDGEEVLPGGKINVGTSVLIHTWAIAADAAVGGRQRIQLQQAKPTRDLGEK